MIHIIPCEVSQLDILAGIAVKTYKQNYAYLWYDKGDAYVEKFYRKAVLMADLAKPGAHYYLVYDEAELIGYFLLNQKPYPAYPQQKALEISKLYLLRQSTGKGAGKKIMSFIFDLAKTQKHPVLWLMVMESSPAKKFYEYFGFKQTDRTCLDYPNMIDEYRWIITMIAGDRN